MRREEALADLQPEAKQKQGKGKQKLSLALKGFLKNKACNKNRPSAKHKAQKKGAQKTASTKALVKAGSKQHLPEDPPLPPPEQAPPADIGSDDPLLKQEGVVASEAAGKLSFGKQGKITHGSTSGMHTCVTDSGSYQVEPEWTEEKQPVIQMDAWY
jgi:hypothetical protein